MTTCLDALLTFFSDLLGWFGGAIQIEKTRTILQIDWFNCIEIKCGFRLDPNGMMAHRRKCSIYQIRELFECKCIAHLRAVVKGHKFECLQGSQG